MRTRLLLISCTLLLLFASTTLLVALFHATSHADSSTPSIQAIRPITLASPPRPPPRGSKNSSSVSTPVLSTVNTSRSQPPPPAPAKYRLAYVILGSGTRDDMLVTILGQLRDKILPWTPGDVLFFHTGEYQSPGQQAIIKDVIPSAQIHRIPPYEWTLPRGLEEEDAPKWKYSKCCPFPMHGVGYRHMCRWYSNGLFKYLHKLGYDWVFRLDEDSELYSDVRQNMVHWMAAHGKQYAFRLWDWEDADMIWSLPELTAWFLISKDIRPAWLYDACRPHDSVGLNSHGGWNRRIIYNNMFMANVTWWMSDEVQAYLTEVERSNGFYLFRWGDAPVHTMVVRMFLQRPQVHMFGFGYCHKRNCDGQRTYYQPSLQDSPP